MSSAGSSPVYVVVFAVVAGWLLRRLAVFVVVVVTIVSSSALNALAKHAVHRSRPVLADPLVHLSSKSFPAGTPKQRWSPTLCFRWSSSPLYADRGVASRSASRW